MEAKKTRKMKLTPRTREKLGHCKRSQKANLASMLVTQVDKGSSKPQLNPFMNPYINNQAKNQIVLPKQLKKDQGKKTLVLDLDETLVHSSFQPPGAYDLLLPVEIEGQVCYVYVQKRPGVDKFLKEMAKYYELVIYTASLSKYANPLLDWLDPQDLCSHRLFREHCTFQSGIFVKDLDRLDRDLKDTIIIDNSPASYFLHPQCALPTTSWYDDMEDTELYLLAEVLEPLSKVQDVREIIEHIVFEDKVLFNKASQILKGGKLGERSQSQNSNMRNPQSTINDYLAGMNLSQQSGDLNEEEEKVDKNSNNNCDSAVSYFKTFNSPIRKSKTRNKIGPRGGSQRNNHQHDHDQLHFMPNANSLKLHPSNALKNSWVQKSENEVQSHTNKDLTHSNNQGSRNRNTFQTSTLKNYPDKSSIMKTLNNQIYLKKIDGKHSSVARTFRTKARKDNSSLERYSSLSHRNSNEFRTVRRKRELMLFSIAKTGRNHKLDNKFNTMNNSPEHSPKRRPNKVGYLNNHRSYLNKIVLKNHAKSPNSILGSVNDQESSLRITQIGSNTNHRGLKMPSFVTMIGKKG
ncbi:unnamed protein product [Moneuplotes crassus]|uniref:FCP1 homology domain-containing protein n=1 Tax=Euplotes crassus TaxID=5936 RepID=A0AAD1U2H1_EUPCR|nr:unnamed protein product [Moneuplotes crassus]